MNETTPPVLDHGVSRFIVDASFISEKVVILEMYSSMMYSDVPIFAFNIAEISFFITEEEQF